MPRNVKDILAKHLLSAFPSDGLEILGISDVHVVRTLPTELDSVEIRQEFTDIVLELVNETVFHMEFQTTREPALYRFLMYDAQLAMKFRRKVRTVILYIGDIYDAPTHVDIGSAQYSVENVYLMNFDGDAALETVERHLGTGEWTEQDRIRLAFALHMRYARQTRSEAFDRILDITKRISDKYEQNYVAALILGLSGRRLSETEHSRLKEALKMTDLIKEIADEIANEVAKEVATKTRMEALHEMARKLLTLGDGVDKVADVTGLPKHEIEEIRKNLH